jgi:predicted O-methyltransferase YrrM
LLENESLDFVFIDACHEYENVITDINAWLPKIRPGGLLCGHDKDMDGVKKATQELSTRLGKPLFTSDESTAVWAIEI